MFVCFFSSFASASCYDFVYLGGSGNISSFPAFIPLSSNLSSSINTSSWGNVRIFSGSCDSNDSFELPYEIDYFNNFSANFWFLSDFPYSWSWHNFSVIVDSNQSIVSNESPSIVWKDYSYVYHFSDNNGSFVLDSLGSNNLSRFGSNSSLVFVNSSLGLSVSIIPSNVGNNGGFDCLVSQYNVSSDFIGSNDRSVFVWEQVNGLASNNHGEVWAFGTPTPLSYFDLRYENNATWKLDYNSDRWTSDVIVDYDYHFHYVGMVNSVIFWVFDSSFLGSNNYPYYTSPSPLSVGAAFGVNAPFTGCVAVFNGTIDELRLSNKTFSQAYVFRTEQLTNSSNYFFVSNNSFFPDYSNNSLIGDWDFTIPPRVITPPIISNPSVSGGGGGSSGSSSVTIPKPKNDTKIINKTEDKDVVNESIYPNTCSLITGLASYDGSNTNNHALWVIVVLIILVLVKKLFF